MVPYEFVLPTQVYGGPGRSREIGEKLRGRTDRVLLVYGGGSIKKNCLYEQAALPSDQMKGQGPMDLFSL